LNFLPDTSIWVDYLRHGSKGPAAELDGLLAKQVVMVCGPVVAEVTAGASPPDRDLIWQSVGTLPWAELDHSAWRLVGELSYDLRSSGRTLPLTDVVIAVACGRAKAALWTQDADFERIVEVYPDLSLHTP
jgi:predicted nucleic acid-binding protein